MRGTHTFFTEVPGEGCSVDSRDTQNQTSGYPYFPGKRLNTITPPSETGDAVPPVEREGAGGRVLALTLPATGFFKTLRMRDDAGNPDNYRFIPPDLPVKPQNNFPGKPE
jgi:hypothetical protein